LSKHLNIAVAGLGTVGAGLLRLLAEQGDLIEQRCGRRIVVCAVSARERKRDRGVDLSGALWFDDPVAMAGAAEAEVIVELIGGADGVAKAVCDASIDAGHHVVTANKALIAHHGTALACSAEQAGVNIGYEAAVAGGIPIIKALREGLAGNRISCVYGILNGTCNYMLTAMGEQGLGFDEVLAEAQRLGYAEADYSFDVDGIDSAHKLAILAALAFGAEVDFAGVHAEGIRNVSPVDIDYAAEFGYRIKLLGIARRNGQGLEQRVHACMVPEGSPIAHVSGVFNAVVAQGDFVGNAVFEGQGAGAGPTASAVAADLMDIASGRHSPSFGVPASQLERLGPVPMEQHRGAYYVRLMVVDRPGVIAGITAALRDEQVSLESMLQRGRAPDEAVPLVMTTHETQEAAMTRALARIGKLDSVIEQPHVIRIEPL
jgi:homoserine dehydrogenase